MSKEKYKELKEEYLIKVTGGINEFPEAEELQLSTKEKKELERKKDKENEKYN